MLTLFTDSGLIIGLTRENLDRLPQEPILFETPDQRARPVRHFAIVFGETKPAILATLESFGLTIPQAIKDDVDHEPS